MGTDYEESSFAGQWLRRIYTEAFRRLGIPVRVLVYPTLRLSAMADRGALDGEFARFEAYGAVHPGLVRVEEPLFSTQLALFTAAPGLSVARLEDLPTARLRAEYRRGVVVCEKALKPWQPAARVFDVTTTGEGLANLLQGPPDLFLCETDLAVSSALRSPKFKGVTAIRQMLAIGEPLPLYPYLHSRHAELAPRLAATLKRMKTEGLIERYRHDTLQAMEPR